MAPAEGVAVLKDQHVAFTGRLASMSREDAAALVRAHGGDFDRTITRNTSILVVGQEGWPLRNDGRLTRKLQKAGWLQRNGRQISILPEDEFLRTLGLDSTSEGVHRLHTTSQLSRILNVPGERIRAWVQAGLIRPAETVHGVCSFDFTQVSGAKTLCELIQAGVTPTRIRHSLDQLRRWLGDLEQPLEQLAILERGGRLLVRLGEGNLAEPTGQLRFDFQECPDEETGGAVPLRPELATPEDWLQRAYDDEDAGNLVEAAQAYRQALLLGGPDPELCFNLGNLLYELGQRKQALERFWQAVELEPSFAEAWNNLGNILAELQQYDEAVEAFERALELEPAYADGHYNLADTLEEMGQLLAARTHWKAYLSRVPQGTRADYARARLKNR